MPRLSALRLRVLDELASQLRFAPKKRTLEQLSRAVALASELDPNQLYPEDWLIHRITGFRPEVDDPAMLVGEALLRDLSAFTERISQHAALAPDAFPMPIMSLDELQARWSVSARTIERYRRMGLVALRAVEDGRARLLFPRSSVESFESRHAATLAAARERSRLSPDERKKIVRIARRAQRRFGWSLNEAARRIAVKRARSVETIRQILLKAGGARTATPRSDARRLVFLRAARAGAPAARLSQKYGKSPVAIRRIIFETRADLLRQHLPAVEPHRSFTDAAVVASWLQSPSVSRNLNVEAARTAGEFVDRARATTPPDRDDEKSAGAAMRFLLWRAARTLSECPPSAPPARLIDSVETDVRWAIRLAAALIRMQKGFILSAVEARLGRPLLELPAPAIRTVHGASMDAAISAVWRFNALKGGRLAALTGIAVDRAVLLWINSPAHDAPPGARARAAGAGVEDWTLRLSPLQRWLDPDPRLARRLDVIGSPQKDVVTLRYGLTGEPPMTQHEIARRLGLYARRIAEFERIALDEARRATGD